MKKLILLAAALLGSRALTIEAMNAIDTTPQSRERLDLIARNLSRMSASTYDLTETDRVFTNVPEQLDLLETITGSFQNPVDVRLQRQAAALRHKLLELHTTALRLLNKWTADLLSKLPNYAQQNQGWQEDFVRHLLAYNDILNGANNAPRGLTAEEQQLRAMSQARITQMRTTLGI